ncbi:hypothetical protein EV426DRAFT_700705 [Tirmania nivea]|nr:hypothetical protein EV426DRAFT_700705 [Tirmania nivea]
MLFTTSTFLILFTPLLGISLMFTSAYSWWNISHLRLPISKMLAFLSTLLPILSLGSIQYLRTATKSRRRKGSKSPPQIADTVFFGIFGLLLLDTVIISLTSTFLPSKPLLCSLNDKWTHLWSSPSERASSHPAIKTIQDSLSCCGLHSPNDKFYPFPNKGNRNHTCTNFYPDREGHACYQPWLQQTQLSAGIIIAAVAGSMTIKIIGFLLIRYNSHPWVQRIMYNSWLGKQEEHAITEDNRIEDVDEDDEAFVYDRDARVRGDGHGNGRGRYLDASERENDRLLENGAGASANTGEVRRSNVYDDDDGGFGAVQPSLLGR